MQVEDEMLLKKLEIIISSTVTVCYRRKNKVVQTFGEKETIWDRRIHSVMHNGCTKYILKYNRLRKE